MNLKEVDIDEIKENGTAPEDLLSKSSETQNLIEQLDNLKITEKDPEIDSGNEDSTSDNKDEAETTVCQSEISKDEEKEEKELIKDEVSTNKEDKSSDDEEIKTVKGHEVNKTEVENKEEADGANFKESSFVGVVIDGKTGEVKENSLTSEENKDGASPQKEGYLKRGFMNIDSHDAMTPSDRFGNPVMQYEDSIDVNFANEILSDQLTYGGQDFGSNSFMLSPDASPMSYPNPPSHGSASSYYNPSSNNSGWFDSPEGSPSPYDQIDPCQFEYTNPTGDCDNENNATFNYNTFLTPPRSVSPPRMFGEQTSLCDQSCMKIVDILGQYEQENGQVGAAEDELKNLLNALENDQDSSLQGLKAYFNGNNESKADHLNGCVTNVSDYSTYEQTPIDPVKRYWQEVQETDSSELNVYLPAAQLLDPVEVEEEIRNACDASILFDLESRVCTVLSNNPLAIIPNDEHRDTNLTVLASRDENNRENITEKIYALSKGLSKIPVCCDLQVLQSRCQNCGNTDVNSFYTPLTLRNVQGYTALSCAVLSDYSSIIVKYLLMLIQQNKQDIKREFSGMRNAIYSDAKDYPFLGRFASNYFSNS